MKSIIITILIVLALIPMTAKAQFNTVSGHAPRVHITAKYQGKPFNPMILIEPH